MSKVFFSGSRKFHQPLDVGFLERLEELIAKSDEFLIGDANGADKAVQSHLAGKGYRVVRVYCMDGTCRNNIGNWDVVRVDSRGSKRDFSYFVLKDDRMSRDADFGFVIWNGESKGTYNNIRTLVQRRKEVEVYFLPLRKFMVVKSQQDFEQLIEKCTSEARESFSKTKKKMKKLGGVEQVDLNFEGTSGVPNASD